MWPNLKSHFSSPLKSFSDKSQICNFHFQLDTFVYKFFTTSKITWYCTIGQWSLQYSQSLRTELHAKQQFFHSVWQRALHATVLHGG